MFEQIEALDRSRHSGLSFRQANSYSFASGLSSVPLSFRELPQASRHYPIVFSSRERTVPQALLSLKRGENAFVDSQGRWLAGYIPIHIRRYPFILARTGEEGHYAVCIDPQAPHFDTEQGEPLYKENGEPSERLNNVMELLKRYHQDMLDTERIFAELENKGLLAEKQLTIGRGDQQRMAIQGFKAVDNDQLKELDKEILGDWVQRGIMGLVYAHLHSLDLVRTLASQLEEA